MIGQMAIAMAFPGFNDLGRLNFLQNARTNSVPFSSSFIGATVSNVF